MSVDPATLNRGRLRGEKVRLERTLGEAWDLCDRVAASGNAALLERYEDRWIVLLGEYETVCDTLASRA